ncbi:MAG: LysR family transcriptional regulator [Gorillibacterium sp.]|nr:LysR family transcriptional regulator [Gorillibacterium sp.]
MSINKYEVFSRVVELGSLTKAGEMLGYTQSGISHAITSLETEFGFPLLTRNRSGIKLTANGEQIIKLIRDILKGNERLQEEVASIHGLKVGTVRIGTFTSVSVHWLPGMIKQFQIDYPQINFELIEGDYREIEQWIEDGVIDCGFVSLPTKAIVQAFSLKQDRMLCLVPLDHPLRDQPFITFEQIKAEPFIIPKAGSDYDVRRVLDKAQIKPRIKFAAGDDYAIIAMVENGLGISILPELVLQGRDHKVRLLELEDQSYRSLGIAIHAMKYSSPATKRFIQHVQQWLQV